MRLHIHDGETDSLRTVPDAAPADTLAAVAPAGEGVFVFVVDDQGSEVKADARLADVFGGQPGRVVLHRGKEITVAVHYAGRAALMRVSPGVRLASIRVRAIAKLGIDAATAADLGLRVLGGAEDLELDKPIAAIARGKDRVELELVALVRPQG